MYIRVRRRFGGRHTRGTTTDTQIGSYARIIFYILYVIIIITIGFNDRRATEILTTPPLRCDDFPDPNDTNNDAMSFSAAIRVN